MSSKAATLRRKKARKAFPALASIEKKEQHRVGGKFAKDDDPRKTARTARERQLTDAKGDMPKGDALNPILGHEIGYVIHSECGDDQAKRLWDTWQAYCMAERTYRMRILGTTGEPKGASIQMQSEPMQSDQSMRVDVRTDDEKDRQAVTGYMRWQGHLGSMASLYTSALRQAERGNGKPLWQDGAATSAGVIALAALQGLHELSK